MFYKHKFTRPSKAYLKFNKLFFFKQLKIGIPLALETSVCALGLLILQKSVNRLGYVFFSGFAIAMKIEDLLIVVFFAIANAASVFTAQNFGAQKFIRIQKGTRAALIIGFFSCAVFAIIFLTLWDSFVLLFINQTELLHDSGGLIEQIKMAARRYIDIVLAHYPVLCLLMIIRNVVQSLGKTLFPLLGSAAELFARFLGAFSLVKILHYDGVCYCTLLSWYLALILVMFAYVTNIKKLIKIETKKH